jgi:hypothetical protein
LELQALLTLVVAVAEVDGQALAVQVLVAQVALVLSL